ncbi:MAG: hypothetical protein K0S27_1559 [Gammaproteobacteria bacterium]|jgi:23S rRNA G2445 N2-methylase RlmL|nr:hypothetical protein [Gammaproteobacteria bacterium]
MHFINPDLIKNIRRGIYKKAQTVKIIFPAGLGTIALDEAKAILSDPWFARKFTGEIYLLKNEIQIRSVYMFAIVELLLRNYCFSDLRLVIFKDKVMGKKAFEKKSREIKWGHYINKTMSIKIKVDSVSSKAFHETALKQILTEIIKPYVYEVISGENSKETTCLYAELYKDKLTMSISLAGEPLYKRGYREKLTASAPLREDAAACCIRKALLFSKKYNPHFSPSTVLIPFSGTGTFAFEYCQTYFQFIPALLQRKYALQKMTFFRKSNFDSLMNKSRECCLFSQSQSDKNNTRLFCIDNSSNANAALRENIISFSHIAERINFFLPPITNLQDDFFKINLNAFSGNIFMLLNPPYGIRLRNNSPTITLYKRIASKINDIFLIAKKNHYNVLGFILCPTEASWSAFIKNLTKSNVETYHFTQGGLDIRVCQFFI